MIVVKMEANFVKAVTSGSVVFQEEYRDLEKISVKKALK